MSPSWARSELYAVGLHVATYVSGSTYFDHSDWLGSVRARSTVSGSSAETCTSLAFGDAQTCTGTDWSPLHFTGQDWDSESNLTHFLFRQLSTTQGRWISPDPAGMAAVDPSNPQTWDRYAYVANNPIGAVDQLGLWKSDVFNAPRLYNYNLMEWLGVLGYRTGGGVCDGPFCSDWVYTSFGTQTTGGGGTQPANKSTNCSHGLGIGVQGGGTAAAGLKSGGVVTGQLGGGLFVNSSGPSVGGYASGALAGRWGSSTGGFPAQSLQAPWVGGAYAGYGPGIFITNAGSPAQLGGPFAVMNVDIGVGIGKASIQLAADKNGTILLTINQWGGPAPYADGLGFDVSGFTSNTKTVGTGCNP
jgi:RHS repeat-associated protein